MLPDRHPLSCPPPPPPRCPSSASHGAGGAGVGALRGGAGAMGRDRSHQRSMHRSPRHLQSDLHGCSLARASAGGPTRAGQSLRVCRGKFSPWEVGLLEQPAPRGAVRGCRVPWLCPLASSRDSGGRGHPEGHSGVMCLLSQRQSLPRSPPPSTCTSRRPKRTSRARRPRWPHCRT